MSTPVNPRIQLTTLISVLSNFTCAPLSLAMSHCHKSPVPPVHSIHPMMIVWRLGRKIIRTVICAVSQNYYTMICTVFEVAC